jgi:hypothetical protein
MKKKLKIDLLYKGQENENLATIIAQNNAGVNPVCLQDIASYLWVRRSIHELYLKGDDGKDIYAELEEDNETRLMVYEKGKVVAVIEEIEVYELNNEVI